MDKVTLNLRPQFATLLLSLVKKADPQGVFCGRDIEEMQEQMKVAFAALPRPGRIQEGGMPSDQTKNTGG